MFDITKLLDAGTLTFLETWNRPFGCSEKNPRRQLRNKNTGNGTSG
jgi:hypothetical protein